MTSFWTGKKVLVTGGSGFIGSGLINELNTRGALISVIDKAPLNAELLEVGATEISYFNIDILSDNLMKNIQENTYDYIFHLAGSASVQFSVERTYEDFEVNLRGTLNLLETLRTLGGSRKLIFLSSAAVYGNPEKMPINEDDLTVPISPYGISKLAAERYLYVYSNIHGIKAISVRPFSVYGPGQKKQVIYDIIRKVKRDPKSLELFGSGKEARDFIYISDLVDALLLLAEKSKMTGEVYNAASGSSTRISLIAHEICDIMGVDPSITYRGSVRPGVPISWQADINRLRALGFNNHTEMKNGLTNTVKWFEDCFS